MSPAFSSFAAFLNMGGYAVYVWLAVAVTVAAFGLADGAYPVGAAGAVP